MEQKNELPSGTNLRLLFAGCECEEAFLYDFTSTVNHIGNAIQAVGFQFLENTGHSFKIGGYTSVFILAESHVIIHTWPEHNHSVIVEISVCDYLRPNRERTLELGQKIADIFKPKKTMHEVLSMVPRIADHVLPGQGYFVEIEELIASHSSMYQDILLAKTIPYGRALLLDGVFQTSEKDDFFYHEPLVHVPMLSSDDPKHVLICGGGDGGAAHEVLKHPSVTSCTIVDIDREVVELSKTELACIHRSAFDDPRINVHIGDSYEYIKNCAEEFDVVLMDVTDPEGISEMLFTKEFFEGVRSVLSPNGCMSLHMGAPLQPNPLRHTAIDALQKTFDTVYPYLNFVPCYGTLLVYFVSFKGEGYLVSPEEIERRIETRDINDLNYINPETFHALFSIPPFLQALLPKETNYAMSR